MKEILLISERFPGTYSADTHFALAKILSKLGRYVGVLLPLVKIQASDNHDISPRWTSLSSQELYFKLPFDQQAPEMGMMMPREALRKCHYAIFEPLEMPQIMERALLYSYLNNVETITLISDETNLQDADIFEFSDHIISTVEVGEISPRKTTIRIDEERACITASQQGRTLLHVQLPEVFKGYLAKALHPFAAGYLFGLTAGSNTSAAVKLGISMAGMALDEGTLVPTACSRCDLVRHYEELEQIM